MRGPFEVVPVLGFVQPLSLAVGLAGLTTPPVAAKSLMPSVASIRHKQSPAVAAPLSLDQPHNSHLLAGGIISNLPRLLKSKKGEKEDEERRIIFYFLEEDKKRGLCIFMSPNLTHFQIALGMPERF